MDANTPQAAGMPLCILRARLHTHCARRKQVQANAWLSTLEQRYATLMVEKGQYVKAMAHDADNDGRGQDMRAPDSVNAMEVRFSERWLIPSDPTVDYDSVVSIAPDGTRTAFTAHLQADDAKPSKQASKPLVETVSDRIRAAGILPTQAEFD